MVGQVAGVQNSIRVPYRTLAWLKKSTAASITDASINTLQTATTNWNRNSSSAKVLKIENSSTELSTWLIKSWESNKIKENSHCWQPATRWGPPRWAGGPPHAGCRCRGWRRCASSTAYPEFFVFVFRCRIELSIMQINRYIHTSTTLGVN
jgi:hypothetical protein